MSVGASPRPRVVVADDDTVFRYTINLILKKQREIVGEAANGAAAVALAGDFAPYRTARYINAGDDWLNPTERSPREGQYGNLCSLQA
jgi:CheY-like chemotaxis protein